MKFCDDAISLAMRLTDKDRPPGQSLFERLLMMLGWTDLRIRKRRDRRALLRLTDEQLRDIGLSRAQIDGEYIDAWIDRLDSSRHR